MTTARLHNIDTLLILFPDFQVPSRSFIEGYASVEGIQSLAPYGISLEMAQTTLWWLGIRPCIVLPRAISLAGVDAVVEKLVSRRQGRNEMATVTFMRSTVNSAEENEETQICQWRPGATVSHFVTEASQSLTPATVLVVSIVDHCNQESMCTALLVRELLKKYSPLSGAGYVLEPHENLPASVTAVLVMSSNGCFQRPNFVRQLFQAEARGIGAIPIIVDESFRFPSDALFQELRALSRHILSDTHRDPEDLIALIKNLFEEIGIHVRPQDSQGVLEVCEVDLGVLSSLSDRQACFQVTHEKKSWQSLLLAAVFLTVERCSIQRFFPAARPFTTLRSARQLW